MMREPFSFVPDTMILSRMDHLAGLLDDVRRSYKGPKVHHKTLEHER